MTATVPVTARQVGKRQVPKAERSTTLRRVNAFGILDGVGDHVLFYLRCTATSYMLVHHRHEVLRLLAATTFGSGALAAIGGTVVSVAFLTSFAGVEVGLQGYSQLSDIGVEALSGFVSAYINTRLAAPIIAAIALVATVGAGFTAQLAPIFHDGVDGVVCGVR